MKGVLVIIRADVTRCQKLINCLPPLMSVCLKISVVHCIKTHRLRRQIQLDTQIKDQLKLYNLIHGILLFKMFETVCVNIFTTVDLQDSVSCYHTRGQCCTYLPKVLLCGLCLDISIGFSKSQNTVQLSNIKDHHIGLSILKCTSLI